MRLEEHIKMRELELDGTGGDDSLGVSVGDRYRDLAGAIWAWDNENEQLMTVSGSKVSGNLAHFPSPKPNFASIAHERCPCTCLASRRALPK